MLTLYVQNLYTYARDDSADQSGYALLAYLLSFQDNKDPDYIHQFHRADYSFVTGFLEYVTQELQRYQYPHTFVDQRTGYRAISDTDRQIATTGLRPFQKWAAESITQYSMGIGQFPTRFGKSFTMFGVHRLLRRPRTLILVPTNPIAKQMHAEAQEFLGEPVGTIGGGVCDIQNLTIAVSNSIVDVTQPNPDRNLPPIRPQFRDYLQNLECIIWDEVHLHGAMYIAINEAAPNALYRYGLSATPVTGKTWWDMSALGYLGPVRWKVTSKFLADHGILEPAQIFFWENRFMHQGDAVDDWRAFYKDNIVNNDERNERIATLANTYVQHGLSVLIFVSSVAHGDKLQKMIPGSEALSSKRCTKKKQKAVKDAFNAGECKCVIVTKLWRLGVTVYADIGINAEAGKGGELGQNNVQMLGRGLMPKGSIFYWHDFADMSQHVPTLLTRQAWHRLSSLLAEEWPVHIVKLDGTIHQVHSVDHAREILLKTT